MNFRNNGQYMKWQEMNCCKCKFYATPKDCPNYEILNKSYWSDSELTEAEGKEIGLSIIEGKINIGECPHKINPTEKL